MSTLYTLIRAPGVVQHCVPRRVITSSTLDRLLDQRRKFDYTNTTVWNIAKLVQKSNSSRRSKTAAMFVDSKLLSDQSLDSSG